MPPLVHPPSMIVSLKNLINTFGNLKFYFINSLKQSQIDGRLSIFERQTSIKLIAKKDRDKKFLKKC